MQNPYNNNEKKFPDFFPEQIKIQRRNNHLIGGLPTNQWTDFYNKKTNPVIFKPLNKQNISRSTAPPQPPIQPQASTQPQASSPPESTAPQRYIQSNIFRQEIINPHESWLENLTQDSLISNL